MTGFLAPNDLLEGRYRVEREVGAGGMATVYLAYDVRDGHRVALTARTRAVLTANGVPLVKGPGPKGGRLLVPASAASGLWLEFLQR